MKKIAVTGSCDFTDFSLLKDVLDAHGPTQLVSGGAKGAYALAELYAKQNGLEVQLFKPDWKMFGRGAGDFASRSRHYFSRCRYGS